jgi:serine/threonine protein kinase
VLSDSRLGTGGRARLLHEAQAVAKLDHPNIVAVYDAGESDGSPFIVMQFVEGDRCTNSGPRRSRRSSQSPDSCVPRSTTRTPTASSIVI